MKKYFTAFSMAQSMFCSIPWPFNLWDEQQRPKMLLFLPFIGLEIGAVWVLTDILANILQLPILVKAFIMCIFPYYISGFIHLDGFMDVTDAASSCRSMERRREILKDSHVGSFAVVWCVIIFIAGFSLFASADKSAKYLLFVPFISRSLSALAITALRPMGTSSYSEMNRKKSDITIYIVYLIFAFVLSFLFFGKYAVCNVAVLAAYLFMLYRRYKQFDGMNGDISGYCITISELCAVAVWVLI